MAEIDWDSLPYGGDLFGEIHLADDAASRREPARLPLFPGLAACGVVSAAAAWLADHYDFPIILLGLLVGLAMNFVSGDPRTHRGLDFAGRTCLRLGIVVLGLQVTFHQIAVLGPVPFGSLLLVMACTMAAGWLGARASGQSSWSGLLAGGATAICGASAALALYGVIGKARLSQAQFAVTLVGISLASAAAMSTYPMIAHELGLNDRQAGFLIGASIHDVAQAIGGGYAFSDVAGTHATIVKLARVALLAPIVALVGLFIAPEQEARIAWWRRISLPGFIVAFLLVVALNSLVALPRPVAAAALSGSKALLLLAVTATAMRTRLDLLLAAGWRAAMPVLAATVASLVTGMACALTLI
ncbi:MAG: putative sulfate exporter family transporter [Sphingomonadales bacterium]|nr:putative sulfate exporter family transporter [Sphingomonadales bacterium]